MSSFVVSKADIKNFSNTPVLKNMRGIFYLYSAPPETVKHVIPAPLEYVAPVVVGYFTGFSNTTFGGPYVEFCIGTVASYKGQTGIYPLSLMLAGHGAEMAVKVGTNCCGFPKKIADRMDIDLNGDELRCSLDRHGVRLFEAAVKLDGEYNLATASNFLAIPGVGDVVPGGYFIHHLNYIQTEAGNVEFLNVDLCELFTEHKVRRYTPGKLVHIKVQSSPDDPYGELQVLAPMGAAYFETDGITMKATKVLEALDPEEAAPYLMSSRFDRGMFGDDIQHMTNY